MVMKLDGRPDCRSRLQCTERLGDNSANLGVHRVIVEDVHQARSDRGLVENVINSCEDRYNGLVHRFALHATH